jgi:hypothetical protein
MSVFFKLLVIMSLTSLFGEITELPQIEKLKNYTNVEDLIIFDIDNTLIEPAQLLGSDQWFYNALQRAKKKLSKEKALEVVLSQYFSIQHISKMQTVEKNTANIVQDLQNKNKTVIGLTTRNLDMLFCTIKQLKKLQIDLNKTSISKETFFFNIGNGVLYKEGIVFCDGTHKGHALFSLLDTIKYNPKRIIFINDKYSHIKQIENSCEQRNIPFLGLRYGYLDEKINKTNYKIGEIQQRRFKKILSDKKALKILQKKIKLSQK